MKHYVYILAYPESMGGFVFYVGKGKGNRINEHECEARRGKQANVHKNRIINKIWGKGEQVVKKKVGYFESEEEVIQYEIATIVLMRGYGHLVNVTDGGGGVSGWIPSEEWRRKQSKNRKGRPLGPLTTEQRQHQSEARKSTAAQNQLYALHESHIGRKRPPRSEEWRRKQCEANLGKKLSEKTRQKMSKAHEGRPSPSEETRRKIGEGNSRRLWSDESRRKASDSAKQRHNKRRTA